MNKMLDIRIEKITVNIGVGEGGEKLVKGEKVLQLLTKQKPIKTISKTTNKDWGIKKGTPIGCKTTLRKGKAEKFLKDALWVRNNQLPDYCFDNNGNFSFGIPDYTGFQGMKYDPEIGIFGLDVAVSVSRKGARVKQRRRAKARVGTKHKVKIEETMEFVKSKFNVEVI